MSRAPPVSSKQRKLFGGTRRELRLERSCIRVNAWLNGCWADGMHYKIWDKFQFHRATLSKDPLTVSYIECVASVFKRRYKDLYEFERIRIGRSWRIKISRRGAVAGVGQHQVTVRLAGYIRQAARARGVAHVDALFLQRFCATTGLPRAMADTAARTMKRIKGLRLRRRGRGAGKKLVASLQQSSPRYGSLREKRNDKTVGPEGQISPDKSSRAAAPQEKAGEPAKSSPPARWRPSACFDPPFFVGGRWVAATHLFGLACYLAYGPMRAVHTEGCRVCWRYAHPRNLAYRALYDGHDQDAIVEAWRRAVAQSHQDALERDELESPLREPSSAVIYAWRILWADKRSRDEKWRALFAAPSRPRAERAVKVAPATSATSAAVDAMPAENKKQQRTIEAALAERGMTIEDLMQLERADRDRIVAEIIARPPKHSP